MDWIYKLNDPILETLGGCLILFILIIGVTRIIGLRSFAKFTTYDFAITIAIGSIISSTLTSSTTILHGFTSILGLLFLTKVVAYLQKRNKLLSKTISNQPILLMEGDKILHDNLNSTDVEEEQLIAKLREANVLNFNQVCAVVLEATGDISVLHKSESNKAEKLEEEMLKGVSKKGRKTT